MRRNFRHVELIERLVRALERRIMVRVLRVMRVPLLKYSEYQPNAHHLVEHCRDHGLFDLSIAMKPDRLHVLCAKGARQAVSYLICSITNSDVDTEETPSHHILGFGRIRVQFPRDCLGADAALSPQTTIHVARNPLELVVRQVARLDTCGVRVTHDGVPSLQQLLDFNREDGSNHVFCIVFGSKPPLSVACKSFARLSRS